MFSVESSQKSWDTNKYLLKRLYQNIYSETIIIEQKGF